MEPEEKEESEKKPAPDWAYRPSSETLKEQTHDRNWTIVLLGILAVLFFIFARWMSVWECNALAEKNNAYDSEVSFRLCTLYLPDGEIKEIFLNDN